MVPPLLFLLLFFPSPPHQNSEKHFIDSQTTFPLSSSPSPWTGWSHRFQIPATKNSEKSRWGKRRILRFHPFPSHKARESPAQGWKNRLTFDTEKYSSRIYAAWEGEARSGSTYHKGKGASVEWQDTRRTRVIVIRYSWPTFMKRLRDAESEHEDRAPLRRDVYIYIWIVYSSRGEYEWIYKQQREKLICNRNF